MSRVRIADSLAQQKVLVTRVSARSLAEPLRSSVQPGDPRLELDFAGIEGLTPSFLDELLGMINDIVTPSGSPQLEILLLSPPTRLSSKFAAVGKARGYEVSELEGDRWVLRSTARLTA